MEGGPVEGYINDAADHECHVGHQHVEKIGYDDTGGRTSERIFRFQSDLLFGGNFRISGAKLVFILQNAK